MNSSCTSAAGKVTPSSSKLPVSCRAPFVIGTRDEALTLLERSRHIEADEIRAALASCNGDREAVCKALGISKTTLWRKLNGTVNNK